MGVLRKGYGVVVVEVGGRVVVVWGWLGEEREGRHGGRYGRKTVWRHWYVERMVHG